MCTFSSLGNVSKFAAEFQNSLRMLVFEKGEADIESGDGIFTIKNFHLRGNAVRGLNFSGRLGIGSKKMLDLNSNLNILGIVLPVEIDGTVDHPDVSYSRTAVKFMSANAFNIIDATLDTTGSILKKGGKNVKKLFDNLF